MKFSAEFNFWQFLKYNSRMLFDRPVLRSIEVAGLIAVFVVSNLVFFDDLAFWVLGILLLLYFLFIFYMYLMCKSSNGRIPYQVIINDEQLILTMGSETSFAQNNVTIEKNRANHTWFVGRAFFVRRSIVPLSVVIPKDKIGAFKAFVAKNGWDLKPTHYLLRYVGRISLSVIFILSLIGILLYSVADGKVAEVPVKAQRVLHVEDVTSEINAQRKRQGLDSYSIDASLQETSSAFCKQMSEGKFFEHVNPSTQQDGYELIIDKYPESSVQQLLVVTEYNDSYSPSKVVEPINKDGPSRQALFSSVYTKIGVAVCDYTVDDVYTYNVVIHLAS